MNFGGHNLTPNSGGAEIGGQVYECESPGSPLHILQPPWQIQGQVLIFRDCFTDESGAESDCVPQKHGKCDHPNG